MAKAKRANHRSGDDVVVDESGGAVDNGVRGEDGAMLTGYRVAAVGNGRTPTGQAPNGTPPNGQVPNGQGFNGPGPDGPGPNGPGPNGPASTAQGPNAQGPNAQGSNAQGPHGQAQGQNGSDGRSVTVAQNGDARSAGFGTPVRVDEIAVAAMALSEDLLAATKGLPESTASRQFRRDLDEAADTFRTVANELETTAGNLVRLAATEGQNCGVTWGICADHGLTTRDRLPTAPGRRRHHPRIGQPRTALTEQGNWSGSA
jgi:hypothetical protein